MKGYLSSAPRMWTSRFKLVPTNMDYQHKQDKIGNGQLKLQPSTRPCSFIVQFNYGPLEMSSFRKPTYWVRISISVLSNVLLALESLWNTSTGANLVNKAFLPSACKESSKPIEVWQLRPANFEIVKVEGILPLFICLSDLRYALGSGLSKILPYTYWSGCRLSTDAYAE